MTLPVTRLDTVEFEQLVLDARGLIPRYAPQWTDHNLHDPGITLIELLAWIADQEIYRVGFVGDRHLKSFAALLGVHERKAQPARGLVWPPDKETGNAHKASNKAFVPITEPVELELNIRIVNPAQPDIPFTLAFPQGSTDRTRLLLSDAQPLGVHAVAGASRIAVNYLSDRTGGVYVPDVARDAAAQQIELSFDRPIVRPFDDDLDRLVALGISVISEIAGAHEEGAKGWGPIVFDYRVGAEGWQRVDVVSDGTLALARTGVVFLRIPAAAGTPSVLRLRFDRGFFPVAPKLTKLTLNVLPIVQLETIEAGMVARSNGLPDQVVSLDISNLPEPGTEILPLAILTEEENTRVEWARVPDFARSGPNDSHYVADTPRKRLRFGNGINGRIPPRDAAIRHDAFHVTHGREGNLGANLWWRLPGSLGDFGKNIEPISGGSEASSVKELIAEARKRAIGRDALLTNDDLRDAALNLPGFVVGRADVLVRHDPSVPGQQIRGTRTLIVVPGRDPLKRPPGPVPAQYLDAIRGELAPRRLLGERLSIEGPSYVDVDIALRILLAAGFDADAVRRDVERSIRARLTDLRHPDGVIPWQLGRPVTAGEIKGIAARVKGVAAIQQCSLSGSGAASKEKEIRLDHTAIAIANDIRIDVEPEINRGT
ncbi:hypothetical protein ABIF69_004506 [Bradyrhizobium japonicum]